jgi:AI-2 transport protein TqsA
MVRDRTIETSLVLCTAVLVFAGLYFARAIFAPVTFSLFVIAIVWPFQSMLQARMPKLLALAITVLATLVIITVLASLIVWGFSRVGQWFIDNAPRFQSLYAQLTHWLDDHGVSIGNFITENYSVGWVIGPVREVGGRIYNLVSFSVIAFVFTVLGLLEIDIARMNIERLKRKEIGQSLMRAGADIAVKLQMYMLVRTVMSVLTGIVVWGFALLAGVELATAWGVIAFVLNYAPFIGPLVATLFPTLFALAQFESWELAVAVFLCLNLIQFSIGSYLEPRIAGAALSISPFLVLFAVFFWSVLWGIPGAFLGVPIAIAFLVVCEQHESTRWIAVLCSGRDTGLT